VGFYLFNNYLFIKNGRLAKGLKSTNSPKTAGAPLIIAVLKAISKILAPGGAIVMLAIALARRPIIGINKSNSTIR